MENGKWKIKDDERRTTNGERRMNIPMVRNVYAHSAFTLTEIMVVVGIVVIILVIAIPAFSVWESRKREEAINLVSGLLQTAQTQAMTGKKSLGLFFYVNPSDNAQYIWPIEPYPEPTDVNSAKAAQFGYKIRGDSPFRLPPPMRVVPLDVLRCFDSDNLYGWRPEQLANNQLDDAPSASVDSAPFYDPATTPPTYGFQYHRNFFVVLFGADGRMVLYREVHISDVSGETKLPRTAEGVVKDNSGSGNPIRFFSVRGVIVYNDETFGGTPSKDGTTEPQRDYLKVQGQPIYVHPLTGTVIKGTPQGK